MHKTLSVLKIFHYDRHCWFFTRQSFSFFLAKQNSDFVPEAMYLVPGHESKEVEATGQQTLS